MNSGYSDITSTEDLQSVATWAGIELQRLKSCRVNDIFDKCFSQYANASPHEGISTQLNTDIIGRNLDFSMQPQNLKRKLTRPRINKTKSQDCSSVKRPVYKARHDQLGKKDIHHKHFNFSHPPDSYNNQEIALERNHNLYNLLPAHSETGIFSGQKENSENFLEVKDDMAHLNKKKKFILKKDNKNTGPPIWTPQQTTAKVLSKVLHPVISVPSSSDRECGKDVVLCHHNGRSSYQEIFSEKDLRDAKQILFKSLSDKNYDKKFKNHSQNSFKPATRNLSKCIHSVISVPSMTNEKQSAVNVMPKPVKPCNSKNKHLYIFKYPYTSSDETYSDNDVIADEKKLEFCDALSQTEGKYLEDSDKCDLHNYDSTVETLASKSIVVLTEKNKYTTDQLHEYVSSFGSYEFDLIEFTNRLEERLGKVLDALPYEELVPNTYTQDPGIQVSLNDGLISSATLAAAEQNDQQSTEKNENTALTNFHTTTDEQHQGQNRILQSCENRKNDSEAGSFVVIEPNEKAAAMKAKRTIVEGIGDSVNIPSSEYALQNVSQQVPEDRDAINISMDSIEPANSRNPDADGNVKIPDSLITKNSNFENNLPAEEKATDSQEDCNEPTGQICMPSIKDCEDENLKPVITLKVENHVPPDDINLPTPATASEDPGYMPIASAPSVISQVSSYEAHVNTSVVTDVSSIIKDTVSPLLIAVTSNLPSLVENELPSGAITIASAEEHENFLCSVPSLVKKTIQPSVSVPVSASHSNNSVNSLVTTCVPSAMPSSFVAVTIQPSIENVNSFRTSISDTEKSLGVVSVPRNDPIKASGVPVDIKETVQLSSVVMVPSAKHNLHSIAVQTEVSTFVTPSAESYMTPCIVKADVTPDIIDNESYSDADYTSHSEAVANGRDDSLSAASMYPDSEDNERWASGRQNSVNKQGWRKAATISGNDASASSADQTFSESSAIVKASSSEASPGELFMPSIEIGDITISEGEIEFEASISSDMQPLGSIAIKFTPVEHDTSSHSLKLYQDDGVTGYVTRSTQTSRAAKCVHFSAYEDAESETVCNESLSLADECSETVSTGEVAPISEDILEQVNEDELRELKEENEKLRYRLACFSGHFCQRFLRDPG